MSRICGSEPVSWWTLERYRLGELPAAESRLVRRHIADCPACRSCVEVIDEDAPRILRPLPTPAARPRFRWPALRWIAAGAMAAAALVLVLPWDGVAPSGPPRPERIAYKGGELAIALVARRGEQQIHDPTAFTPEDRFKALATCPPGEPLYGELVVYQGGEASFPLAPGLPLACGNRRPLPGAFRLTGAAPAWVCLVTAAAPPDRGALASPDGLPQTAVCVALRPAGP